MSNVLFCHPNLIDQATVTGSGWTTAAPLTEVQDSILGHYARSTGTTASINIDLPRAVRVMGVGLWGHNIAPGATVTVTAYSDAARTTQSYTSGAFTAWRSPVDAEREWDEANWEQARPPYEDVQDADWGVIHPMPAGETHRYWTIEITDSLNPYSYIEVGRVFIGYGWQAPVNFAPGAEEGWVDDSEATESYSGVEFFRDRKAYPILRGSIEYLEEDPAFGRAKELLRRAKLSKEVMVIPDPADTTHLNRRAMLARMRDLSPIELQAPMFGFASFSLKGIR